MCLSRTDTRLDNWTEVLPLLGKDILEALQPRLVHPLHNDVRFVQPLQTIGENALRNSRES